MYNGIGIKVLTNNTKLILRHKNDRHFGVDSNALEIEKIIVISG